MMTWHMEDDVVMLLKTLKKEYLQSTLDGKLCFSCPEVFSSATNNLLPGQQDSKDSYLTVSALHIVVAPIISKENEPIQYGQGKKLTDKGQVSILNDIAKHSPMNCFRKVTIDDIQQRGKYHIVAFGNLVDRIREEMGHDAYLLIPFPVEFLKQLNEKEHFFGHSIHYGEIDEEYEKFLEEYPTPQSEMFQKRMEYAWQKEYRLVLKPRADTEKVFVDMGSIRDIAIGGDLEELRLGIAFWDSDNIDEAVSTVSPVVQ